MDHRLRPDEIGKLLARDADFTDKWIIDLLSDKAPQGQIHARLLLNLLLTVDASSGVSVSAKPVIASSIDDPKEILQLFVVPAEYDPRGRKSKLSHQEIPDIMIGGPGWPPITFDFNTTSIFLCSQPLGIILASCSRA